MEAFEELSISPWGAKSLNTWNCKGDVNLPWTAPGMEDPAEAAEQCREQRKKLARKECLRNSYGCFRFSVVGRGYRASALSLHQENVGRL